MYKLKIIEGCNSEYGYPISVISDSFGFCVAVDNDLNLLGFTTCLTKKDLLYEGIGEDSLNVFVSDSGDEFAIKPGTKNEFLSDYYYQYDAYNEWWETIDHKEFTKKLVDVIL